MIGDLIGNAAPTAGADGRRPAAARIARVEAGGQTFAIALDALAGIERTDRMQRNPGGGDVVGWLLGAREEIPVASLARRLGLGAATAAAASTGGSVLVLGEGAGRVGHLVDRIERLATLPSGVYPLPAPLAGARWRGPFRGVVAAGDRLLLELDPDALADRASAAGGADASAAPSIAAGAAGRARPDRSVGTAPAAERALFAELLWPDADPPSVALPLDLVLEVLEPRPIFPVPGAPAHLPGLLAWRDRPLPVLDLGGLLAPALTGRGGAGDAPRRFVVARAASGPVALAVGGAVEFVRLPRPARSEPVPATAAGAPILGLFRASSESGEGDGPLLVVADLDRALAGELA